MPYDRGAIHQQLAFDQAEQGGHGQGSDRPCGGDPGGGGPCGRSVPGSANLESLLNTVTQGRGPEGVGEVLQVVGCRCRARTCRQCGPVLGWEARQVLESKAADLLRVPQLISFTVGHEHFDSPEAAFDHVTQGRYIARALAALSIKRWVWVLEFHRGRAENNYMHKGWPHWHCVVDVSERSITPDDLRRLHRLCRTWRLGGFRLSRRKRVTEGVHAIRYITKYLMKPGYIPGWFQKGTGRRMIQGSRAMGRLCFKTGGRKAAEELRPEPRGARRPLGERVAECRLCVTLLRRQVVESVTDDGEIVPEIGRTIYGGRVDVAWDDLVKASVDQVLPLSVVCGYFMDGHGLVYLEDERMIPIARGDNFVLRSVTVGSADVGAVTIIRHWAENSGASSRVAALRQERLVELLAA